MNRGRKRFICAVPWLAGLLALPLLAAAGAETVPSVPVTEEPLHIIRHRGDHFIIYTNSIEPGVWTQYHEHRKDLLAILAANVTAASQIPGEEERIQEAPAGTVLFYPYANAAMPFIHRVGVLGDGPFINIGLEFQDDDTGECSANAPWNNPVTEAVSANRRGQAYRLTLPPGVNVALPRDGRGLLLVPLGPSTLVLDLDTWAAIPGDFQIYDGDTAGTRPAQLRNGGKETVSLIVFSAC